MTDPLEYELTDNDRRHLRDMLRGAGYAVALRIWTSVLDATTETALQASRHDPLGNRDDIARKWAYVAMFQQAIDSLKSGIAFELNLLNDKEAPPATQAIRAERRRRLVLGYLDPLPESPGEASRAHEVGMAE